MLHCHTHVLEPTRKAKRSDVHIDVAVEQIPTPQQQSGATQAGVAVQLTISYRHVSQCNSPSATTTEASGTSITGYNVRVSLHTTFAYLNFSLFTWLQDPHPHFIMLELCHECRSRWRFFHRVIADRHCFGRDHFQGNRRCFGRVHFQGNRRICWHSCRWPCFNRIHRRTRPWINRRTGRKLWHRKWCCR